MDASARTTEKPSGIEVEIRVLTRGELHAATALLAEGMRDNPLHARVFGAGSVRRQRRLSRFLEHLVAHIESHGTLRGAFVRGDLVGVLGALAPGRCRPSGIHMLHFARVIATGNPPTVTWRVGRWLAAWRSNDLAEPHWPLARWRCAWHGGAAVSRAVCSVPAAPTLMSAGRRRASKRILRSTRRSMPRSASW